jgi:hypothetical protein
MDNPEKLATLVTQDTRRRQLTQNTIQYEDIKRESQPNIRLEDLRQ